MLEAAQTLGVSYSKTAMAIAGLRAKDIMGHCVFVLILSGIVVSLGLYFL